MLRLMLLNCDMGIPLSAVCFREQLATQKQLYAMHLGRFI